jgi:hypothetical protein
MQNVSLVERFIGFLRNLFFGNQCLVNQNKKGGERMNWNRFRPVVKKTVVKVFHVIGRRNRNRRR